MLIEIISKEKNNYNIKIDNLSMKVDSYFLINYLENFQPVIDDVIWKIEKEMTHLFNCVVDLKRACFLRSNMATQLLNDGCNTEGLYKMSIYYTSNLFMPIDYDTYMKLVAVDEIAKAFYNEFTR